MKGPKIDLAAYTSRNVVTGILQLQPDSEGATGGINNGIYEADSGRYEFNGASFRPNLGLVADLQFSQQSRRRA